MSEADLERAREHCFMGGVDDSGMRICEANIPFGLAKIHHVQKQLGVDPDATFVGSPDATITRNDNRWKQGFGYGGVYRWSGDFTVLDIKPNACGMLVGELPALPAIDEVRDRLHRFEDAALSLDGITIESDLDESNHFVDVFEVSAEEQHEPAPKAARYMYIMHSSGHENRGSSERGVGLYWDQSAELMALARSFDTPWGKLRILEADRATEWYEFYKRVEDFNHRRRELLAEYLFPGSRALINATHQGLVRSYNQANIGCYTFEDPSESLFPLTLSPVLPAFLVRAKTNVSARTINQAGWAERIAKYGLAETLSDTNLLPHGGGYTYPQLRGVARTVQAGPDDRRFELLPADPNAAAETIVTPRGLKYAYRGLEVKQRMEELDLGRAVVKLDLKYVLTA